MFYNSFDDSFTINKFNKIVNLILGNIAKELQNLTELYDFNSIEFPKVAGKSEKTPIAKVLINRKVIYARTKKASFGVRLKSLRMFLLYDIITFVVFSFKDDLKLFNKNSDLTNYQAHKIIILFFLLLLNDTCINNGDIVALNKGTLTFLFKFAAEVFNKDYAGKILEMNKKYIGKLRDRKKLLSDIVNKRIEPTRIKHPKLESVKVSEGFKLLVDVLINSQFNVIRLLSFFEDNPNQLKEMLISSTGLAHRKF